MLKESIIYTDFNGVERNEDFYFHLSQAEVMEMEYGTAGGLGELIQKVSQTQDAPELIRIFKDFILKTYGEKSLDGKHFTKSKELSEAFSHTEAYSQLFIKLATDSNAAVKFINGVFPPKKNEDTPATIAARQ